MWFLGTAKFPLLYRGVVMCSKEDGTLQSPLGKLVRISGYLNDWYLMCKSQGHYPLLETKSCPTSLVTLECHPNWKLL